MGKKFLTIDEYSGYSGLPIATVREKTKSKNPPFEIEWSGNKAYIIVEDEAETQIKELSEKVDFLTNILIGFANHAGFKIEK